MWSCLCWGNLCWCTTARSDWHQNIACSCNVHHAIGTVRDCVWSCYRFYQDLAYEERSKMLKDRLKKYSQKVCECKH